MSFNEILGETIRDTFTQILGEVPTKTIFTALQDKFSIRQEEIADRLPEFDRAIVSLLGPSARILLDLISKRLYGKLGLPYSKRLESEKNFLSRVEKARRFLDEHRASSRRFASLGRSTEIQGLTNVSLGSRTIHSRWSRSRVDHFPTARNSQTED